MVLNSCSCTGAASMPSSAHRARQSCMALWASNARAAAAQPARQVLEWKTMPRYLKLTTTARGWPAKRSPAASAVCCADCCVRAPLRSISLVFTRLTVSPQRWQYC